VDVGDRWALTARQLEILDQLKAGARRKSLWNFFLTEGDHGYGLNTVEYAYLAEEMGHSQLASEVFNCNAPDTGNMEVLARYGSPAQQSRWLEPLLNGEIRSAYAMTEPAVASSDATNISASAVLDGEEWIINGDKTYISGAGDPRCAVLICMVRTDPGAPRHRQHSQILVPMDAEGVEVVRPMDVFSLDHAPHGHMHLRLRDVRVPADNLLLGVFERETDSKVRAAASRGLVKLETPELVRKLMARLQHTPAASPERVAIVNVLARFHSD